MSEPFRAIEQVIELAAYAGTDVKAASRELEAARELLAAAIHERDEMHILEARLNRERAKARAEAYRRCAIRTKHIFGGEAPSAISIEFEQWAQAEEAKSAGAFARRSMTVNDSPRYTQAEYDQAVAASRAATIEECAAICTSWASSVRNSFLDQAMAVEQRATEIRALPHDRSALDAEVERAVKPLREPSRLAQVRENERR